MATDDIEEYYNTFVENVSNLDGDAKWGGTPPDAEQWYPLKTNYYELQKWKAIMSNGHTKLSTICGTLQTQIEEAITNTQDNSDKELLPEYALWCAFAVVHLKTKYLRSLGTCGVLITHDKGTLYLRAPNDQGTDSIYKAGYDIGKLAVQGASWLFKLVKAIESDYAMRGSGGHCAANWRDVDDLFHVCAAEYFFMGAQFRAERQKRLLALFKQHCISGRPFPQHTHRMLQCVMYNNPDVRQQWSEQMSSWDSILIAEHEKADGGTDTTFTRQLAMTCGTFKNDRWTGTGLARTLAEKLLGSRVFSGDYNGMLVGEDVNIQDNDDLDSDMDGNAYVANPYAEILTGDVNVDPRAETKAPDDTPLMFATELQNINTALEAGLIDNREDVAKELQKAREEQISADKTHADEIESLRIQLAPLKTDIDDVKDELNQAHTDAIAHLQDQLEELQVQARHKESHASSAKTNELIEDAKEKAALHYKMHTLEEKLKEVIADQRVPEQASDTAAVLTNVLRELKDEIIAAGNAYIQTLTDQQQTQDNDKRQRKQIKDSVEELQSQVEDLQQNFTGTADNTAPIAQITAALEVLRKETEGSKADNKGFNREVHALKTDMAKLRTMWDSVVAGHRSKLEKENDRLRKINEFSKSRQRVAALRTATKVHSDLGKQVENLREAWNALPKATAEPSNDSRASIKHLSKQMATLFTDKTNDAQEIGRLRADVAALTNGLKATAEPRNDSRASIKQLTKQMATLRTDKTNDAQELGRLRADVTALTKGLKAAMDFIDTTLVQAHSGNNRDRPDTVEEPKEMSGKQRGRRKQSTAPADNTTITAEFNPLTGTHIENDLALAHFSENGPREQDRERAGQKRARVNPADPNPNTETPKNDKVATDFSTQERDVDQETNPGNTANTAEPAQVPAQVPAEDTARTDKEAAEEATRLALVEQKRLAAENKARADKEAAEEAARLAADVPDQAAEGDDDSDTILDRPLILPAPRQPDPPGQEEVEYSSYDSDAYSDEDKRLHPDLFDWRRKIGKNRPHHNTNGARVRRSSIESKKIKKGARVRRSSIESKKIKKEEQKNVLRGAIALEKERERKESSKKFKTGKTDDTANATGLESTTADDDLFNSDNDDRVDET